MNDIFLGILIACVPTFLGFIMQIVFAVISKHNADKTNKKLEEKLQDDSLKRGVQAQLRHTLRRDGNKYIEQGHIEYDQLQDFENMYMAYHNLGQNGVMDVFHEQVHNLPIDKK